MASPQCFYPDGRTLCSSSDPQLVACDPTASVSACCAIGDSCVGSGLCYSNDGGIYRGGCTDSTWESKECSCLCIDDDGGVNGGAQDGPQFLQQCERGGQWSCLGTCDNTSTSTWFPLSPGPIWAVNITGEVSVTTTSAACATSVSETSSATSATTPLSTATPVSGPSSVETSSCPTVMGTDKVVAVGAGVGVPLGLLAVIAASLALCYRHRWKASIKRGKKAKPDAQDENLQPSGSTTDALSKSAPT